MTTWADIVTGDVVLGADGLAWYVERSGRDFALHRPDRGTPTTGRPALDQPVTRLSRDVVSITVDRLRTVFPELSIMDHWQET